FRRPAVYSKSPRYGGIEPCLWRARRDLNPRPFPERVLFILVLQVKSFSQALLGVCCSTWLSSPTRSVRDLAYGPTRPANKSRVGRGVLIRIVLDQCIVFGAER